MKFIGRCVNDSTLNKIKHDWPFELTDDAEERIQVRVGEDSCQSLYYPEEILAMILEKVKLLASDAAGCEVK